MQGESEVELDAILALSGAAVDEDDFERAASILSNAREEAETAGEEKTAKKIQKELDKVYAAWAADVNKLGDKLYRKKRYREAMQYYKESIEILKRAKSPSVLKEKNYKFEYKSAIAKYAQEVNNEGDALFKAGKFEEAIEVYQRSVDLIEQTGRALKARNFTGELHASYEKLAEQIAKDAKGALKAQDWERALALFQQAKDTAIDTEDEKLVDQYRQAYLDVYAEWAQVVNKQGDEKFKAKEYDAALPLYIQSVDLARKSDNPKLVKNFEQEMRRTFEEQAEVIQKVAQDAVNGGNFYNAIEIFQESIEIAIKSGNDRFVSKLRQDMNDSFERLAQQVNEMGDKAFTAKEYETAAELYKRSIELARRSSKDKLVTEFETEYYGTFEGWADDFIAEGDALLKVQQWEIAAAAYEKAVEKLNLAQNYKKRDKIELQIDAVYGDWAATIHEEATSKFKDKQFEEALALYNRAIELAEGADDQHKVRIFQRDRDKCLRKMA